MLLKIQPDESLTSFVMRNLLINGYAPNMEVFKGLAKCASFGRNEVNKIASAMGWPGCYGFNRLIHHHTMDVEFFVIKNSQDLSYSGKDYTFNSVRYSDWTASYCPDCVREDLESFGFSYWKRFCTQYVKVCYKHNVVLLNHCPFCGKPFSRKGHTLDVMWRKCNGKHLAEAPSLRNEDLPKLKRAIILHGLYSYSYHICDEVALRVLQNKAASLISIMPQAHAAEMESVLQSIVDYLEMLTKMRSNNNANRIDWLKRWIIDAIATVYEHFEDFLIDLRSVQGDALPIDSLWATYQAGGIESAHFVEEDYTSGVGHWFCPFPSSRSEDDRSGDGYYRRRPKQYPCCNFPHPKFKGQKLKMDEVSEILPGIPQIKRKTSVAIG